MTATLAAPDRTLEQRREGLRRANAVRSRRAQLKRDLKAGRATLGALLYDPPDYLLTAKTFDLLLAVPKYGRVKINKILSQCRISPTKTIGGLSERQRGELVAAVSPRPKPRRDPSLARSPAEVAAVTGEPVRRPRSGLVAATPAPRQPWESRPTLARLRAGRRL